VHFVPLVAPSLLLISDDRSWSVAPLLAALVAVTAVGGIFGQRMRVSDDVGAV
jgi:hypothetical protein